MPGDLDRFYRAIDQSHGTDQSIVLRYRNAMKVFDDEDRNARYRDILQEVSCQEGVRIFKMIEYRGVELCIMDETTLMHTGTMRSIDGCTTISRCKLLGYDRVVFESGGNSGSALSEYGQRAGIESFFFLPAENVYLLDSSITSRDKVHLVAVERPGLTKDCGGYFATYNEITHIPKLDWRYTAAGFRGFFLLEQLTSNYAFDWISQTISAAFGPIGIYMVLDKYLAGTAQLPRFLGVQQEANCPMYRSWKHEGENVTAIEIDSTDNLLSRILYDVRPQTYGSHRQLNQLLSQSDGDIVTVNLPEFDASLNLEIDGASLIEWLQRAGITIPLDHDGRPVERTGLMALAGAIKAIDSGEIERGQKVLCCLTSGDTHADHEARAECFISSENYEEQIRAYSTGRL